MDKLIAELRDRVLMGGSIGHVYGDELEQLVAALEEKDRILVTWAIHGPQVAWRPIAEAPILARESAPEGYIFNCLLQDGRGVVGEGCARYVSDGRVRGSKHVRILRWYFGDGSRESRVCADPRYYQPLPQPRKD